MTNNVTKKRSKLPLIIGITAAVAIVGIIVAVLIVQSSSPERRATKQLEIADRYLEELDYEQAVAAYFAVLDIDPKNEDAYVGLTDAYIAWADAVAEEDSIEEAIALLEQAIDELEQMKESGADEDLIDEQIARLQKRLSKLMEEMEDSEGIAEPGEDTDVSVDDPYARLDAGEYEEVLELYLAMLEDDPTNPEIYLVIVEAYLRMGDYDKALEYAKLGYEKTGDERLKEKVEMIEGGNIVDSAGRTLKMTWSEDGEIVWWHEYTYDDQGRRKSTTVYDAAGNQTDYGEYEYDEEGRCTVSVGGYSHSDGGLVRHIYYYDASGRKIREEEGENINFYIRDVTEYLYQGDENTSYRRNVTSYDKDGNVSSQSYEIDIDKDNDQWDRTEVYRIQADGRETLDYSHDWEYDEKGHCIKYIHTDYDETGTQIYQSTTVYEYDEDGNLVRDITYDNDGNIKYERNYQ